MSLQWLVVAAVLLVVTANTASMCPDGNWTKFDDSCYRWFTRPDFWYVAEQTCVSHGGHLVSIRSTRENGIVGRLSNCSQVWIGRFGIYLNSLRSPSSYSWTDATPASSFSRHDFSQLKTVHQPLIRTDGEFWLNSLYHESHPFMCKVQSPTAASESYQSSKCPDGWWQYQQYCYIMPDLEANFNEANFYCQRKSAQLVSVMNEAELSFVNTLNLGSGKCDLSPLLVTVWVGLIKLNPCFPDGGGRELCYQWTDFSGKHLDFPRWATGHPNSTDWTVNCVQLTGDRLYSDKCHNRRRFVCKAPMEKESDRPEGLLAAYDFRRGLQNLVNSSTYRVHESNYIPRNYDSGACFQSAQHYAIFGFVNQNETIMMEKQWTMFFRVNMQADTAAPNDYISPVIISRDYYRYLPEGEHSLIFNSSHSLNSSVVAMRIQLINPATRQQHDFSFNITSHRRNQWNDYAITVKDMRPEITVNGQAFGPNMSNVTQLGQPYYYRQAIYFGNPTDYYRGYLSNRGPSTVCAKCFGMARRRLSQLELRNAYLRYCE